MERNLKLPRTVLWMRERWGRYKRKTLWNRYLYSISILCSSVLLGFVSKKKNVETAEPIRVQFFCETTHGPGKVYECSEIQKLYSKALLSVFLVVCLFVSNKRQMCRTDPVQIFLWDLTWPKGRFWILRFLKILHFTMQILKVKPRF